MKRMLYLLSAAALLLTACHVTEPVETLAFNPDAPVITATFESGADTRTALDENELTGLWSASDEISIFDGDKVNGIMAIYISCLSFCAEKERENIAFRLNQGRQLAIKKGVKMGRPNGSIKTMDQLASEYSQVIKLLKRGQSVRNTAKICGVSTSTVLRVKKAFNL